MFILPPVMVLMLIAVVSLVWAVLRFRQRAVWQFLALAVGAGIILWFFWGRDLSYTVRTYVNDQLAGSYEEGFRTWYKVFVTAETAVILSATVILVAGALHRRDRPISLF